MIAPAVAHKDTPYAAGKQEAQDWQVASHIAFLAHLHLQPLTRSRQGTLTTAAHCAPFFEAAGDLKATLVILRQCMATSISRLVTVEKSRLLIHGTVAMMKLR